VKTLRITRIFHLGMISPFMLEEIKRAIVEYAVKHGKEGDIVLVSKGRKAVIFKNIKDSTAIFVLKENIELVENLLKHSKIIEKPNYILVIPPNNLELGEKRSILRREVLKKEILEELGSEEVEKGLIVRNFRVKEIAKIKEEIVKYELKDGKILVDKREEEKIEERIKNDYKYEFVSIYEYIKSGLEKWNIGKIEIYVKDGYVTGFIIYHDRDPAFWYWVEEIATYPIKLKYSDGEKIAWGSIIILDPDGGIFYSTEIFDDKKEDFIRALELLKDFIEKNQDRLKIIVKEGFPRHAEMLILELMFWFGPPTPAKIALYFRKAMEDLEKMFGKEGLALLLLSAWEFISGSDD